MSAGVKFTTCACAAIQQTSDKKARSKERKMDGERMAIKAKTWRRLCLRAARRKPSTHLLFCCHLSLADVSKKFQCPTLGRMPPKRLPRLPRY
mmetsp:Transcript_3423/g.4956  ORF Transcript_3423/g.4956 Transcript_3423/m.4956 type:complete len:93 (-) Transcript_3423:582-860(-)